MRSMQKGGCEPEGDGAKLNCPCKFRLMTWLMISPLPKYLRRCFSVIDAFGNLMNAFRDINGNGAVCERKPQTWSTAKFSNLNVCIFAGAGLLQ